MTRFPTVITFLFLLSFSTGSSGIGIGDLDNCIVLGHGDLQRLDPYIRRGASTPLPIDEPLSYGIRDFMPINHRKFRWSCRGNERAMHAVADRNLTMIFLDGIDLHNPQFHGPMPSPAFQAELMHTHGWSMAQADDFIKNAPTMYYREILWALEDGYFVLPRSPFSGLPEQAVVLMRDISKPTFNQQRRQLHLERPRASVRVLGASPEVQLRYNQMRRMALRRSAGAGLRCVRGAGVGLGVQIGLSESLKATTEMDDDTANMVVMPISEGVGMLAVDMALPTVSATTGTSTAAATSAGATVAAGTVGGLAVVTEATRRSADQHSLKLAYDQSSMEMGTSMTVNLMCRNAHLRDIGEISQEELIRRNSRLAVSARREGERTVKEAQFIADRYANILTATWGTTTDGFRCWLGLRPAY